MAYSGVSPSLYGFLAKVEPYPWGFSLYKLLYFGLLLFAADPVAGTVSKDLGVLNGFDKGFNLNSDVNTRIRRLWFCDECADGTLQEGYCMYKP